MLKVIIAPLLGGVIGYITNELAIKMLFHPHRALYVGKWHVPFTPGLIPGQKERIAKSLGDTISNHLLNAETIRSEALSDATREKLRAAITAKLEAEAASELTVRATVGRVVDPEKFADFELRAVDAASEFLIAKLREADIGTLITAEAMDSIRAKLQPLGFARFVDAGMLDGLMGNLTEAINAKIEERAPRIVHEKLLGLAAEGLNTRVCDAARPHTDKIPALVEHVMELYENILTNNLEDLLRAAKLDVIIENKIRSFDAAELERLVFQLMKRELNAIIYLGAALGFLMGFINLLL